MKNVGELTVINLLFKSYLRDVNYYIYIIVSWE